MIAFFFVAETEVNYTDVFLCLLLLLETDPAVFGSIEARTHVFTPTLLFPNKIHGSTTACFAFAPLRYDIIRLEAKSRGEPVRLIRCPAASLRVQARLKYEQEVSLGPRGYKCCSCTIV